MTRIVDLVAPLVALAEAGIPKDIQDLLVNGDPMRGIAPGALAKAMDAARPYPTRPAAEVDPTGTFQRAYLEVAGMSETELSPHREHSTGTPAPSSGEWRPIIDAVDQNAAPWDGAPVLIATNHNWGGETNRVHRAKWTDAVHGSGIFGWAVEDCKFGPYALRGYTLVTHWMPLPASPTSGGVNAAPADEDAALANFKRFEGSFFATQKAAMNAEVMAALKEARRFTKEARPDHTRMVIALTQDEDE